jgi:dolichol-phosphate mannosyltransferase
LNSPGAPSPWLVLPTLNEVENLEPVVSRALAGVPSLTVLVVDDDSRDGTAPLADRLAAADGRIRVLHRRGPKGYGEALTEGFRHALSGGASAVATMDCDFSHDPGVLPRVLEGLASAPFVIGSRYVPGGEIRDWSRYRLALSALANTFVRVLFRLSPRDCTSGYRAYRRAVLETIPWDRLHSPGYSFLVEVLFWACRAGYRPMETPICYVDRKRGKSKMGVRQIVSGALNLLRVRFQLSRSRQSSASAPANGRPPWDTQNP